MKKSGGAPTLSEEEVASREAAVKDLRAKAQGAEADWESVEALAVNLAELGKYADAEKELVRLCESNRAADPVEAWRLLGEVRARQSKWSDAAAAYRNGIQVGGGQPSIEQLQVRSGPPGRPRTSLSIPISIPNSPTLPIPHPQLPPILSEPSSAPVRPPTHALSLCARPALQGLAGVLVSGGEGAAAVDLVRSSIAAASAASSPSSSLSSTPPLNVVELKLLLGKVYSQWKGHGGDALNVYDELIASDPEDFRGHLAKGVLLKEAGRSGDAQRSFIQARFLAPPEARPLVDRIAGRS